MYETGTATDVSDLLTKLSTFLAGAGWTINKDAVQGSGRWLSVQKGSDLFLNFISDPAAGSSPNPGPYIYLYGATSYNGGAAYTAQPNTSAQCSTNKMTGAFTSYHFFEGDDYIHIVVELGAGFFRHIHGGTCEKICTFTGGTYVQGTNIYTNGNQPSSPGGRFTMNPWQNVNSSQGSRGSFYANIDGAAEWFTGKSTGTTGTRLADGVAGNSSTGLETNGLDAELFKRTPNATNGLTPLLPITIMPEKNSGLWNILGRVKDVRNCSMLNMQPGDTITIGSDEWLCFPWHARTTTTGDSTSEKSGYFGFAYRKNTA